MLQQEGVLQDVRIAKVEFDLFDDLGGQLCVGRHEAVVRVGVLAVGSGLLSAGVAVRVNFRRRVVKVLAVLGRIVAGQNLDLHLHLQRRRRFDETRRLIHDVTGHLQTLHQSGAFVRIRRHDEGFLFLSQEATSSSQKPNASRSAALDTEH